MTTSAIEQLEARILALEALRAPAVNAAATIGAIYQWLEMVEQSGGATSLSGIATCNAMMKSLRKNAGRTETLVMQPLRDAIDAMDAKP